MNLFDLCILFIIYYFDIAFYFVPHFQVVLMLCPQLSINNVNFNAKDRCSGNQLLLDFSYCHPSFVLFIVYSFYYF